MPTTDGNVFESEEPWGWATYHYGNWMPTESNGWVWVPGSTWYPATVEWRTTPENEPVDTSYIGWAPTPPPNYEPPPSYAPPSYYPGSPATDSLSSPLWIFARAASFLLGFGQPYTPAYSYIGSGILLPPAYVPVFFSRTVFITSYATPTYYPSAFFGGRRFGAGYYNMGPSATYISRVTNINRTVINQTIINNSTNFTRIHNVVPPRGVIDRHAYIRQIIPPALARGQRLPPPRLAPNAKMAQANLNRPNFVPAPKNVPRLTATIPRLQPAARLPGGGLPGTALPTKSTMPLTPQMTQQIQQLPPHQRFEPAKAQPFKPAVAQPGPGQPGTQPKAGQFGTPVKPGPGPAGVPGQPGLVSRGLTPNPGRCSRALRPNLLKCNPGSRRPVRPNRENSTRGLAPPAPTPRGLQPRRLLPGPPSPAACPCPMAPRA